MVDVDATPRLAPVSPPYDEPTGRLLGKWMPPGVEADPLLLFRLLAVHRDLADRLRPMASGLLNRGLLPARDREVLMSRVTGRCGAEYEWGVHAAGYGAAVGVSDETLDALSRRRPDLDADDALLVRAADDLFDDATLSVDTLGALGERYTDAQVLELLILCGWYRTLSTVITSTALPLEPWGRRFPADPHRP